jgi:ubiquinone/menaquinone biosynthesis C-methylase UbiE
MTNYKSRLSIILIMKKSMRDLVKEGYNKGEYSKVYSRTNEIKDHFEKMMCDELLSRIKEKSKILDLGCGTGIPYDYYFASKKHKSQE